MAAMAKKELYRRLRWRIIILTLVVSIGPLILLGGAIYYQFALAHDISLQNKIRQLASSQGNAVDVFLRERTTLLAMLVDTNRFDQLSRQETLTRNFVAMNQRSDMLGLIDLGVIDSTGLHVAYVGPFNLKGLHYDQQPWFSEVMAKGKFISDVYLGFRGLPHFIIAVRGRDGDRSWVLRATIDSEAFSRLVHSAQVGRRGDAFIVNENGVYQTAPRFNGTILARSDLIPRYFGQGAVVVEKKSQNGFTVYSAGAWLHNKNWLLVIRQDTTDEMGGLLVARNTEIVIISGSILVIMIATIFIVHMVVRHLEATDKEMDELSAQLIQSDKLAALGKMAAGIAHEINNPLAVIGEKAGWMKDLLEDEPFRNNPNLGEFKNSIRIIENQVERSRKITHHMLGFARRMEPHLDDVQINHVLDQTIELLDHHASLNGIAIQRHYFSGLPIIASDQSQLQQVFLNLINNAIDAIGSNGQIDITTELSDSTILIHIKDDGAGIPKEHQRRIFDPFFSTKPAGRGAGMGLSISFSIIERMGGTMTFISETGQGTTFTITLPVVIPEKK